MTSFEHLNKTTHYAAKGQKLATPRTPVFARDATGLVKQFGTMDMLLIAAALVFSLQAAEVQFPWFYGFNPGANLTIALLIAAVPFILLMLVYWAAGVIMPRSGSDYVWTGRIFHPAVGFAWSSFYLLALFGAGYAASVVAVSYGAASSLSIWGLLFNSPQIVSMGTWLSSPMGAFVLSLSLTLLFALIAVLGYGSVKGVLYVGWLFAIIGIVAMWILLGITSPATFATKWNTVLASYTSYSGMMDAATKLGWSPTTFSMSATLISIPIAVLFLLGGNYINAVSGEIKNTKRTIPMALLLSLFLGIVFWGISSTITLNATGTNWMSAVGYLFDNNPAALSKAIPFQPSMPLLLSIIAYPNQASILVIAMAFIIGSFPTLFFYYWIPSRYIFAWSFDRIVPSRLSLINNKFHTPHYAILAITLISTLYLVLFNFTSWPSAFAVSTLIWFSSFILPSLAVALLPFVKKDIYSLAPAFFKRKIAGIPLLTIIGALSALSFSYMAYISLLNPLLATVTTFGGIVTVGVIVLSLVIYYSSVSYHKRQGLDISIAFKEIPPE